MTNYKFIPFTNVGSRLGNYSISFNSAGFFGLNSGFYLKEGVKNYKRVSLFYDKSNKAVGLKFLKDDKAANSFSIAHSDKQSTGSVTARSFVITNNLNKPKYNGQKIPKKVVDPEYGVLYVIGLEEKK